MFTYLFKKLSLSRNFGICIFNILSGLVPWWHPDSSGMNNPG